MFVRFECGCKGLALPDGRSVCFWACDHDECGLGFHFRDLSDKSHAPLPAEEVDKFVDQIGGLMADGHRYREIRSLLGVPPR